MKTILWDGFLDAVVDSVKLIPFLFLTYLAMEYVEHKMGGRAKQTIKRAGAAGPFVGGVLGTVPQCGFSTVASNLYAGRIITLGTLFAVYLSTSDEMIPIFVSEAVPLAMMLKVLTIKCVVAVFAGFLIDAAVRICKGAPREDMMDGHLCEHEHCNCEKSIVRSALVHTGKIFVFIFLISIVLNYVIAFVSEDRIKLLIGSEPVIAALAAGVVGLIPNCAASVVITELYLEGMIPIAGLFSGLLVSAGVGLLVLFRVNEHRAENIKIAALLYAVGVTAALFIQMVCSAAGVTI